MYNEGEKMEEKKIEWIFSVTEVINGKTCETIYHISKKIGEKKMKVVQRRCCEGDLLWTEREYKLDTLELAKFLLQEHEDRVAIIYSLLSNILIEKTLATLKT